MNRKVEAFRFHLPVPVWVAKKKRCICNRWRGFSVYIHIKCLLAAPDLARLTQKERL